MARRDRVDHSRSSEFAWTYAAPTAREPLDLPQGDLTDRATLEALDAYVGAAWSTPNENAQRSAAVQLAGAIEVWGFEWARARLAPFLTVRVRRLLCRHLDAIEPDRRAWLAFLISLPEESTAAHAPLIGERVDCQVELLMCADPVFHLVTGTTREPARVREQHPTLGARLARLMDTAPEVVRVRAAQWLGEVDWPEARSALRRVLLDRSLELRTIALDAMLDATPPCLTPAELRSLLVDALAHPLIYRHGARWNLSTARYAQALARAVRAVPLADLKELLVPLIEDTRRWIHFRQGLEITVVLGLASELAPDVALPVLRRLAREPDWRMRCTVLEAAKGLTPEDALPLLLEDIADPHPEVVRFAREEFERLTGNEAPEPGLEGVCTELLVGAPSARLRQRIDVLRAGDEEESARVLLAALAEAPSREALVVLLFGIGAFELYEVRPGDALPKTQGEWGGLLVELFGEPALDGLLWLCERWCGQDEGRWPDTLARALHDVEADDPVRERLRARAGRLFVSLPATHRRGLCPLLAELGASAEAIDALWPIAMRTPEEADETYSAREALANVPDDAFDLRLRSELDAALARRDFTAFEAIARIGVQRRSPALRQHLLALLADAPDDAALLRPYAAIAQRLAKSVPRPTWVLEALSHPESHRFDLAAAWARAQLWSRPYRVMPSCQEMVALLERALEVPDREGRAAAAAVVALVDANLVKTSDPRVVRALAADPKLLKRMHAVPMEEWGDDDDDDDEDEDDAGLERDLSAEAYWVDPDASEGTRGELIGVPKRQVTVEDAPPRSAPDPTRN